jgi:hypothetical protein
MIARRGLLRAAVAAAALALPLPAAVAQVKAPEELARLHVLVAADTLSNLGPMIKINVANTRAVFAGGVPADRLNLVVMDGADMTPDNILKKIGGLPVKPNDAVAFLYFGHGGFDQKTDQHLFGMVHGENVAVLLRKDVVAALQAKNAGLTVLLTDCCSNVAPILAARPVTGRAPARDLDPALCHLFFRHRGLVDITAAEKGTFAWFDGAVGGMFTQALMGRLLRKPLAQLDTDKDGFLTWQELAEELREETNRVFQEEKQTWSNRDEVQQDTQYPLFFTVPEPGGKPTALRPTTQPGRRYRLGASVTATAAGVKVVRVAPGSPAHKLGLEPDDVIVSVNGMPARTLAEYAKLLDASPMGKARLEILDARSKKAIVKEVQLQPER